MSFNPFVDLLRRLHLNRDGGSRIFVSYRRDDARGDAGRLTDNLKARFGDKQIFRDVEAIEPGVDFVEAINAAVGASSVLLAVMGPNWLKIADEQGNRRLDDPNDFIRLEIGAALKRNIRVIPVLVGGATMPRAEELPTELESFARRQAHELSDLRWEFDVGQLIETLERLGINPLPQRRGEGGRRWWNRNRIAVGVGGAVLIFAGYIYSEFEDDIDAIFDRSSDSATLMSGASPNLETGLIDIPSLPPALNDPPRPVQEFQERRTARREAPVRAQPAEPVRSALSYSGFDAIGRFQTVVQVYNPG